jgi:hypothetical protein
MLPAPRELQSFNRSQSPTIATRAENTASVEIMARVFWTDQRRSLDIGWGPWRPGGCDGD